MALRGSVGPLSRPPGSLAAPWPLWGLVVVLLTGLLLGAHQRGVFAEIPLPFSYGYWTLRLLIAYLLFAGALALLEQSPLAARLAWPWLAPAAALLTLPLFTLCVTMLDLLLGEPEFGPQGLVGGHVGVGMDAGGTALTVGAMALLFARESLYHLDNHLLLCALIVVPRLLQESAAAQPAAAQGASPAPRVLAAAPPEVPAFLQRFDPPVEGPLLAVQAQEHYVRVITPAGAHCTLYRFGDALRELEGLCGLQVHRSFWVADAGVAALRNDRRGLRIVLSNGEQVPVSARHSDLVQRRFAARPETVA